MIAQARSKYLPAISWLIGALGAVAFLGSSCDRALAVGLVYDDASVLSNLSPSSAINAGASVGTDGLWGYRGTPVSTTGAGAGGQVYESIGEDSPEIMQTVSGIPAGTYDFYAVYWSDTDENWSIRTGVSSGNLTLYNFSGAVGASPQAGALYGKTAAGAVWDVPPPATAIGSLYTEGPAGDLFDRSMLLAKAGTLTVDGSGQAVVFFDDAGAGSGAGQRSWLDGVAYVPANTPIALSATLNANTGAITVSNPTAQPFQIKSYAIDSAAGSLNATQWFTITGHVDGSAGGNGTFDSDPWQVTAPASPATTPFATTVAEAEIAGGATVGGTLAANGGTLSFGNLWRPNRFQDVRITLTLVDDTRVVLAPEHMGPIIAPADFSVNGALGLEDFQVLLTNLHTNISTLTRAEAHLHGDINGDLAVNHADYEGFRVAYDAAFGVGAFAQLVAGVPEPSSVVLLTIAGIAAISRRRRRLTVALGAVVACFALTSASQAQVLLAVDVNARAGDATGLPAGDNTVAGFGAFTLTPATTGSLPSSAGIVNGFNIGVTARRADGTGLATGGMDDRDRELPATLPTLNQLYDDFIFTAAAVGVGGGIDLSINNGGGVLSPNTQYAVSIYSYDSTSASTPAPPQRTANWLDGNSNNLLVTSTSHVGSSLPTTDNQYKFTGIARTDASGNLLLKGRNTRTDTAPSVILNGFEIAVPIELSLEINTSTGAMRFVNEQSVSLDMSYYEIRSASGSFSTLGWSSLDDAEGGDPVGTGWDEAAASNANVLSEVNLTSLMSFSPGASASLGAGFTPSAAQDIRFLYAAPGGPLRSGLVNYVSTPGGDADYDNDSDVDGNDFLLWQQQLGATVPAGTGADGSGNGMVDAADLTLWRSQFGTPATPAAAAVPEPGGLALLITAIVAATASRSLSRFRRF